MAKVVITIEDREDREDGGVAYELVVTGGDGVPRDATDNKGSTCAQMIALAVDHVAASMSDGLRQDNEITGVFADGTTKTVIQNDGGKASELDGAKYVTRYAYTVPGKYNPMDAFLGSLANGNEVGAAAALERMLAQAGVLADGEQPVGDIIPAFMQRTTPAKA